MYVMVFHDKTETTFRREGIMMKKRLISWMLAAAMLTTGAMSLSACSGFTDLFKPAPEKEQETSTPETPETPGNPDGNGEKPEDKGPTAEELAAKFRTELRKEFSAATADVSAEFEAKRVLGNTECIRKGSVHADLTVNGKGGLDALASYDYTDRSGADTTPYSGYVLGYMRTDAVYYGHGTWQEAKVNKGELGNLAAAYRGQDALALSRGSLEEGTVYDSALGVAPKAASLLVKLSRNMMEFAGGTVSKEESGYAVTADCLEGLDTMLGLLQNECDETPELFALDTVGTFFNRSTVQAVLATALNGITAEEFYVLLEATMSEGALAALPEAGDMSAMEYFNACLNSTKLFTYVSNKFGIDLGSSPVGLVIDRISRIPLEIISQKVFKKSFTELGGDIAAFREDAIGNLVHFVLGEDATAEDVSVTITAHFDKDCALKTFTFDVNGTFTYPEQGAEGPTGAAETVTLHMEGTVTPSADTLPLEDVTALHCADVPLPDLEALFAPYISDMLPPNTPNA